MTQKTLASLIAHLPDSPSSATVDSGKIYVNHVTADSRQVRAGSLFVAVAGDSFDGHRFIAAVVEQGAAAIIGTQDRTEIAPTLADGVPYIRVPHSRRALAICAAALHDFPSRAMTVIGVTGTDGKTTTSTILESMLVAATRDEQFPHGRVGVITTVGARICGREIDTGFHVTTPDAPEVQAFLAQMRDAGCEYAIVECTSHGLAQERVSAIEFDVACVTNITHEHIDWHGSREAYIAAKGLLFRRLFYDDPVGANPASRFAILNADDVQNFAGEGSYPALMRIMAEEDATANLDDLVKMVRYGIGDEADICAADIVTRPDRTMFRLLWEGGSVSVSTMMIGDFNVQNILCAASVGLSLGVKPDAIAQGVADLKGVVGRMERIDVGQPFLALVDFAHSPASLERALLTLRRLLVDAPQKSDEREEHAADSLVVDGRALAHVEPPTDESTGTVRGVADGTEQGSRGPKLIAVFGCAGLRDVEKRRLMGQISGRLADFTIITAEDPRTEDLAEINAAIAGGVAEFAAAGAFAIVPDRAEAIARAVEMAQAGDVVAAFGKGHERTMCFGETEFPWSDQETMRNALLTRRG